MKLKSKRRCRTFIWCSVFSLLLICVIIFTETNVRPIMLEVAINDAQAVNEKILNNAVYEALTEDKIDFSDIIDITYDDNQNVKSVSADSVYLSKLKLKIIKNISNGFKDLDTDSVAIRLGSFIDNEFTYGRGPNITFNYEMTNTVTCDYKSEFESTGINQARHKFELVFKTEVCIITPLFQTNTTFYTEILLNEMVIVGQVPKTYADIG